MNRIREMRKQKGLTQNEFADKMHLTQNAVSRYENGSTVPSLQQMQQFARFFGVSIEYLSGQDEKPKEVSQKSIDDTLVSMLVTLDEQQTQRVRDFVAGMIANRNGQ